MRHNYTAMGSFQFVEVRPHIGSYRHDDHNLKHYDDLGDKVQSENLMDASDEPLTGSRDQRTTEYSRLVQ